jgi:hypothetical protein
MKKIISIDGKEYEMKSSAYTQFAYKNLTGRSLLKDIQNISNIADKVQEDMSVIDEITEPLLDISYVMIQEANQEQVKTKEEFYKSINSIYENQDWIQEVITLAINPLSGQLQNKIK